MTSMIDRILVTPDPKGRSGPRAVLGAERKPCQRKSRWRHSELQLVIIEEMSRQTEGVSALPKVGGPDLDKAIGVLVRPLVDVRVGGVPKRDSPALVRYDFRPNGAVIEIPLV